MLVAEQGAIDREQRGGALLDHLPQPIDAREVVARHRDAACGDRRAIGKVAARVKRGHRPVGGGGGIVEPQHDIGGRRGAPGTLDPDALDRIVGFHRQPRGIDQREELAVADHPRFEQVARRPRDRGDDRRVAFEHRVEQGRFARIGWPGENHAIAFAQPLDRRPREQRRHLAEPCRDRGIELAIVGGRHIILVAEVDHRLDPRRDPGERREPARDRAADLAVDAGDRRAALRLAFGFEQVGEPLRLRQIDPAVLQRATGEFAPARAAQPGAGGKRLLDRRHRGDAAVEVEFGEIFAGRGCWPRKPQQQRIVEQRAVRIAQPSQRRAAGLGEPARERLDRRCGVRAADAQHCDRRGRLAARNGEDRIHHPPGLVPASNSRRQKATPASPIGAQFLIIVSNISGRSPLSIVSCILAI
ncbi:MAG: hypothetical protein BGN95_13925 [Sphingomonas sp. 66-10]|nr:MAG: hypothetical protein BGN95_13925 [Sphingomonas sp. 66-10]